MRTLLRPLLLLPLMPVKAEEPDIQCPGANTIEMRWCASKSWEESNKALKQQLSPETLETWKQATREVCAVAYAPYRQGTIYPQMVVSCDDRLNRVLLREWRVWSNESRNRIPGPVRFLEALPDQTQRSRCLPCCLTKSTRHGEETPTTQC